MSCVAWRSRPHSSMNPPWSATRRRSNHATCFEAKIDEYPFIILESKNSNQLKTLTSNVVENRRIAHNVFTTSMIGASAQEQREATLNATDESLDFVVVALFGAREDVEPLTKKFSLFKA